MRIPEGCGDCASMPDCRTRIDENFECDNYIKESKGMTREDFLKRVGDKVFKVTFEKKDGTTRDMTGTVNLDLVPNENRPHKGKEYKPAEGVLRAFDLEKGKWRSVNLDKIGKLETVEMGKR